MNQIVITYSRIVWKHIQTKIVAIYSKLNNFMKFWQLEIGNSFFSASSASPKILQSINHLSRKIIFQIRRKQIYLLLNGKWVLCSISFEVLLCSCAKRFVRIMPLGILKKAYQTNCWSNFVCIVCLRRIKIKVVLPF